MREEQRITIETYNKIAGSWNQKRNPDFWAHDFRMFQSLLPVGSVLELGCGSGTDSRYFLSRDYSYTGVDLSGELLKIARQNNPEGRFVNMDLYELGFESGLFDGFWAAAVLLHIPKEDIGAVLREIKRVLKNGAFGFIAIKEGENEEFVQNGENDRRFFAYYYLDEFIRLLSEAGFQV